MPGGSIQPRGDLEFSYSAPFTGINASAPSILLPPSAQDIATSPGFSIVRGSIAAPWPFANTLFGSTLAAGEYFLFATASGYVVTNKYIYQAQQPDAAPVYWTMVPIQAMPAGAFNPSPNNNPIPFVEANGCLYFGCLLGIYQFFPGNGVVLWGNVDGSTNLGKAAFTPTFMAIFDQRMVCVGTQGTPTTPASPEIPLSKWTVAWSTVSDFSYSSVGSFNVNPAVDSGVVGGFNVLTSYSQGYPAGVISLGHSLYIVMTQGIVEMDPGAQASVPFTFYNWWQERVPVGALQGSVAQYGQFAAFVSPDSVYLWSPGGQQAIGTPLMPWLRKMLRNLSVWPSGVTWPSDQNPPLNATFYTIFNELHYCLTFNAYGVPPQQMTPPYPNQPSDPVWFGMIVDYSFAAQAWTVQTTPPVGTKLYQVIGPPVKVGDFGPTLTGVPQSLVSEGEGQPWANPPGAAATETGGTEYTITSYSCSASGGTATFISANALTSGEIVDIVLTGTTPFGAVFEGTVLSAGLSATQFSVDFAWSDVSPTSVTGTATIVGDYASVTTPAPPVSIPAGQCVAWALPTTKSTPNGTFQLPLGCLGSGGGYMGLAVATLSGGTLALTGSGSTCSNTVSCEWGGFAVPALPGDAVIQNIIPVIEVSAGCETDAAHKLSWTSDAGSGGTGDLSAGCPYSGQFHSGSSGSTDADLTSTAVTFTIQNSTAGSSYPDYAKIDFVGLAVYYTTAGACPTGIQTLLATDVGLSVPSADVVTGVRITCEAGLTGAGTLTFQLVEGGSPLGTSKSFTPGGWPTAKTLGSLTDDWGTPLTGTIVSSPTFGVQVTGTLSGSGELDLNSLDFSIAAPNNLAALPVENLLISSTAAEPGAQEQYFVIAVDVPDQVPWAGAQCQALASQPQLAQVGFPQTPVSAGHRPAVRRVRIEYSWDEMSMATQGASVNLTVTLQGTITQNTGTSGGNGVATTSIVSIAKTIVVDPPGIESVAGGQPGAPFLTATAYADMVLSCENPQISLSWIDPSSYQRLLIHRVTLMVNDTKGTMQ